MNAYQKKRAKELIDVTKTYRLDAEECAMQMAALLQELVDAPEEIAPAELIGLPPVGELQIDAAPPAPSVPDGLTLSSLRKKLGLPEHCAERRILCAIDELIAKQPPADVARDAERLRTAYNLAVRSISYEEWLNAIDKLTALEAELDARRQTAIDAARERQGASDDSIHKAIACR